MFVTHQLSIEEVNNLQSESFVRIFMNVVEHYPAAAIGILKYRPFESIEAIARAVSEFLDTLKQNERELILQQYPDIIGSLIHSPLISEKEIAENISGTSRLDTAERRRLLELNARYKDKYGFPFIIGGNKNDVDTIFCEMMNRLQSNEEEEVHRAMREVKAISYSRIREIVR
ncbi:unnamed protein product [Phaedon cochleariae]|uniref:2-oxo-4-hydroxy-4-carboxy-5-ureidoimidazoline decarboxylase n=1 Tax=Phaedon cochleariae TaxID=80249 RepID=A0A9P0GMX5_PHACE|nr:unnamed protein product [Phaedon cochleariae]